MCHTLLTVAAQACILQKKGENKPFSSDRTVLNVHDRAIFATLSARSNSPRLLDLLPAACSLSGPTSMMNGRKRQQNGGTGNSVRRNSAIRPASPGMLSLGIPGAAGKIIPGTTPKKAHRIVSECMVLLMYGVEMSPSVEGVSFKENDFISDDIRGGFAVQTQYGSMSWKTFQGLSLAAKVDRLID